MVDLTVNGKLRADVKVGEAVALAGVIEQAPHTGAVVGAEWDLDGCGAFSLKST